jgi:hypothetical protein
LEALQNYALQPEELLIVMCLIMEVVHTVAQLVDALR